MAKRICAKLKLNPDKIEVMLVRKVEALTYIVLLTLADSVNSLGVILGPAFLLEKQVNATAREAFLQLCQAWKMVSYLTPLIMLTPAMLLLKQQFDKVGRKRRERREACSLSSMKPSSDGGVV